MLILLVEDEPIVRKLLRNFLEMLGFRVVETSTVEEAQAIISVELVDLIISDYMLSGKSGRYLYEWLLEVYPRLANRFIVISGWPDVEGFPWFIAKPFTLKVLEEVVRKALDSV